MKKLLFLFLSMFLFCPLYSGNDATTKPTHSTNHPTEIQKLKPGSILKVTVTRVESDGTTQEFPLVHNCVKVDDNGTGYFIESPSYYYAITSVTGLTCLAAGLIVGWFAGSKNKKNN